VLELYAQLVLLQDPQVLRLRGDELQGVQLSLPALLLVYLSSSFVNLRSLGRFAPGGALAGGSRMAVRTAAQRHSSPEQRRQR
jgi:hypothetical protein